MMFEAIRIFSAGHRKNFCVNIAFWIKGTQMCIHTVRVVEVVLNNDLEKLMSSNEI
jgi:hypothetical protein